MLEQCYYCAVELSREKDLAALAEEISRCRRCPRLVEWRERVADERRAAFAHEEYWGRPLPGFGDPAARLLLFGLAPAAHGANRTGRMFTGDRSGDFLFASLWRMDQRGGALRAAREPSDAGGARGVPTLERAGAAAAERRADDPLPGRLCLGRSSALDRRACRSAGIAAAATAAVRPRR